MKRAIIIHGWEGHPQEGWFPWLKKELEAKGFEVLVPQMPNPDEPVISEWISKLKEVAGNVDEKTHFIGHSIGCQAILRYLETLSENVKVGNVILVGAWMTLDETTLEEEGEGTLEVAKPWMETPINWEKIKTHCDKFVGIFSDNDYYVPLSETKKFEENLGAKIVIDKGKKHFSGIDGVTELPSVLKEITSL